MNAPLLGLTFALVLLTSLWCLAPEAHAASQEPPVLPLQRGLMPNTENREDQARVSRREASDRARQVFPGRVLSIRLDSGQWRIRMDQEGTVFNVSVDANSGQVNRGDD